MDFKKNEQNINLQRSLSKGKIFTVFFVHELRKKINLEYRI